MYRVRHEHIFQATGRERDSTALPQRLRLGCCNAQIQFGRNVEVINTIGDKRVISIGEAQGTFSAETILSKDYDIAEAMHLNEGGCDTFTMSVTFGGSTCNIYGKTLTCHNCVASAVSLTVQGGRGFIGQGVQAVFTGLTM